MRDCRKRIRALRPILFGLAGAVACAAQPAGFSVLTQPADGRPAHCDDRAVDMHGRASELGSAGCSYDRDQNLVQLRGTVLLEPDPGELANGAHGIRVRLMSARGDEVGRARSDAQGRFSMSVAQRVGATYTLQAVDSQSGEVLAETDVYIPAGVASVPRLELTLPLDPALREPPGGS